MNLDLTGWIVAVSPLKIGGFPSVALVLSEVDGEMLKVLDFETGQEKKVPKGTLRPIIQFSEEESIDPRQYYNFGSLTGRAMALFAERLWQIERVLYSFYIKDNPLSSKVYKPFWW